MLEQSLRAITERIGKPIGVSLIYESEAQGFDSEHKFLNCCVGVETACDPKELIVVIADIESGLGRTRTGKGYADRTIDIDILMMGDRVIATVDLAIPHPRMHQRRFVLQPLCDVAPDVIHPVLQKSVRELLQICTDNNNVYPISGDEK
jgi:2-amino-4-hydroxy-6-hydroxymethyldihydropteridine diphosphokinase